MEKYIYKKNVSIYSAIRNIMEEKQLLKKTSYISNILTYLGEKLMEKHDYYLLI